MTDDDPELRDAIVAHVMIGRAAVERTALVAIQSLIDEHTAERLCNPHWSATPCFAERVRKFLRTDFIQLIADHQLGKLTGPFLTVALQRLDAFLAH